MPVDFANLLDIMGDGVIVSDAYNRIVYWNAAATRIFGFTEHEALGQTMDLIVPERLRQRHNVGFAQSMETGTTRYGNDLLKVPACHKDGRTLSIAFTVAMLFDQDRRVSGVAAVIRDETRRFHEERELRRKLADLEAEVTAIRMSR